MALPGPVVERSPHQEVLEKGYHSPGPSRERARSLFWPGCPSPIPGPLDTLPIPPPPPRVGLRRPTLEDLSSLGWCVAPPCRDILPVFPSRAGEKRLVFGGRLHRGIQQVLEGVYVWDAFNPFTPLKSLTVQCPQPVCPYDHVIVQDTLNQIPYWATNRLCNLE